MIAVFTAHGCKEKKTALTDDEAVEVAEFIEFFPEVSLPFRVADTTLTRKQTDSLLIGYKIFTQFIPDTILKNDFGKDIQPKFYPLGRTSEKGKETYLFVKATNGAKRAGYLICFDNANKYLSTLTLVRTGFTNWSSSYGMLDKKFQITTYRERKRNNEELNYKRNVYIYNSAVNEFSLILTEPNEEIFENVINPIDTLPQKNKNTGDYVRDKSNFISFRDGKNGSELQFFVHFERDKDECIGELKGTARLLSVNTAQYKEIGNPCTIEFTFNASNVVMKEIEGCGSHRDIKCFFDGTFPRKKAAKPQPAKKKK